MITWYQAAVSGGEEGVCSVGKRAAEVYFESLAQRALVSAKGYIALWKSCCSVKLSGHIDLRVTEWLCPLGECF